MQRTDNRVPAGDDVADVGDGAAVESVTGGRDQQSDEHAGSSSLVELCRRHGGAFPDGHRAYRVRVGEVERFAFAKSPGQAALAVCEVERVKDRDLTIAAFEAMGVKQK